MAGEYFTAICAGLGCIIGSGGVTAIIHELSVRRKVKAEAEKEKEQLTQQKDQTNAELMKYFADKIRQINDQTTERFNRLQDENDELRKQLDEMNRKLTELNRWIMVDNAAYRSWLENELKKRDPDIDFPTCPTPPTDAFKENNTESEV